MIVKLSGPEVFAAGMVGIRRRYASINRAETMIAKSHWDVDIIGALGECAVAKATGFYWSPDVNVFKVPDVGEDLHVRTTMHKGGNLLIRERDLDGVYVLAVGETNTFNVCGWIHTDDAKTDEFWRTDKGDPNAWWIPQSKLHPIETLRKV